MKTYYFNFNSGYIGGSGVVVSKTKNEALILANNAILKEGFPTGNKPLEKIILEDLIEVEKDSAIIISNGDY